MTLTLVSIADAVAFSNSHYGPGVGSQFLDSVACTGSETMLTHCSSSSSVYCSGGHNEDAGVKCQGLFDMGSDIVPLNYTLFCF